MLLTKRSLQEYVKSRKIILAEKFQNEILQRFGTLFTDDEGHKMEYFEQDVAEQLRKIIHNFQEKGGVIMN